MNDIINIPVSGVFPPVFAVNLWVKVLATHTGVMIIHRQVLSLQGSRSSAKPQPKSYIYHQEEKHIALRCVSASSEDLCHFVRGK